MLVLRKEIKIGIGAGLTILGIAGVYGLMASLSTSGVDRKPQAAAVTPADEEAARQRALEQATVGLPPPETSVDSATPPKLVESTKGGDPFAESNRHDGSRVDPWSAALTTGRVGEAQSLTGEEPTVIKAPPTPRPDSRLVHANPLAPAGESPRGGVASSAPAPTHGAKYVIQPGDTFSTIAAKVYGSKRFSAALVKANPDVNPSRMKIGREITVPPKESVASVGGSIGSDAGTLGAPIDATRQYRVAPGDTLSHIAAKLYGRSSQWAAIYDANKSAIGPDESRLKVGMLLDLPQKPIR